VVFFFVGFFLFICFLSGVFHCRSLARMGFGLESTDLNTMGSLDRQYGPEKLDIDLQQVAEQWGPPRIDELAPQTIVRFLRNKGTFSCPAGQPNAKNQHF
jgi:hypothetical protein